MQSVKEDIKPGLKMKKINKIKFIFSMAILTSLLIVTGCSSGYEVIHDADDKNNNHYYPDTTAHYYPDTIATFITEQDRIILQENVFFGTGERLHDDGADLTWYYSVFGPDFYGIPGHFISFVGYEEWDEWKEQWNVSPVFGPRDSREMSFWIFIKEFGISKEEFIRIKEDVYGIPIAELDRLVTHARSVDILDLPPEERANAMFMQGRTSLAEIDALFSNCVTQIWAAFPGYGILHNGRAYSPEWIILNMESAIFEEQIPLHEIERVLQVISDFGLSLHEIDIAKEIFHAKAEASGLNY